MKKRTTVTHGKDMQPVVGMNNYGHDLPAQA